jgi:uncharacterized protein
MSDRKLIPGKFAWYELVTKDIKKAQVFYGEVLGWRVQGFPMGNFTYDMIYVGDTMIGGYAQPRKEAPSHWISYISVEDVDAAVKVATANGGRVVEPASDIPDVGRQARIADPQGAEICLFRSSTGNAPDLDPNPVGHFFWNELHTTDLERAIAFYEKVTALRRTETMESPAGKYHVLSSAGAGRGGVTSHLPPGTAPHWLPYVVSDDVDAAAARAKRAGGTVLMGPEDILDVGRVAVLKDPTGAAFSVMKPAPRGKKS